MLIDGQAPKSPPPPECLARRDLSFRVTNCALYCDVYKRDCGSCTSRRDDFTAACEDGDAGRLTLRRYFTDARLSGVDGHDLPIERRETVLHIAPLAFREEMVLGRIAANAQEGTHALHLCARPVPLDHFVATTCDGEDLGVVGFIWSTAAVGRAALYQCVMTYPNDSDRFVSRDESCEGKGTRRALLGYVEP